MYRDAVRYLQQERPSKPQAKAAFGPTGSGESAYLNGAEYYLVYHIDLGQRIAGIPYLHKLGIAFHKDDSYSHVTTWD